MPDRNQGEGQMAESAKTLTQQAKDIGHKNFTPTSVSSNQQTADATASMAVQLSMINQKLDLLIEAIERMMAQRSS
jgi:hypothetical protein